MPIYRHRRLAHQLACRRRRCCLRIANPDQYDIAAHDELDVVTEEAVCSIGIKSEGTRNGRHGKRLEGPARALLVFLVAQFLSGSLPRLELLPVANGFAGR